VPPGTRPAAPRRTPPPIHARTQPGAAGAAEASASEGPAAAIAATAPAAAERETPAELAQALAKAREAGRADLVQRLEGVERSLAEHELTVVVAGEYKQGKSTLVNAVVQTEVCPVDDDVVTSVPTIVHYGPRAEARVHITPDDDNASPQRAGGNGGSLGLTAEGTPISFDDLRRYVRGEMPDDAMPDGRVRAVEVRLDRQMLRRTGLSFVDSPGVGGLESAEGSVVLGVLNLAEALIFVTDASQELTRAEITFLQAAKARCANLCCVVTKTDLHAEWRRIVDLDRGHLAEAGLDVPLIPVSSFLRMRAAAQVDEALNDESGYPALIQWLRTQVVAEGGKARARQVADEVAFVAGELAKGWQAEHEIIAKPEQAEQVVQRLAREASVTNALQSGGAPWQQVLSDGIQDLVADVDHDLRIRLQVVVRSGEEIIARSDPAESWAEFETWLRRQVVTAAIGTYDYLADRAAELTERVGQQFQRDADTPIAFSISAPVAALESIRLGGEFQDRGVRASTILSAARGSYGGMLMLGMAGSLLSISVAAPVMLVLSLGLGRRAVREERTRRNQQHQAEARGALHRYAQEISLVVGKECKDALRRTQRLLRDEFSARALSLHQSTTAALAQAERARDLGARGAAERQAQASQEIGELNRLGSGAGAGGA
jgi:Dynamin family